MTQLWKSIQSHLGIAADGIPGPATAQAVAKALGLHSAVAEARTLEASEFFFAGVRKITGPLDQEQVDIINRLLSAASHWTVGWLAYGLATAWHEARLKPIEEWGKGKGHFYGKPGRNGGQIPYGRGLVQITHDDNYETIDKALSLGGELVANYALALTPEVAVPALVVGMERGLYTGKSLATYITPGHGTHDEFVAARRIINGNDKAELIAGHADRFKDALIAGGWS